MLNKEKYNLPDIDLLETKKEGLSFIVWHPNRTYAILGASNKAESSFHLDAIGKDEVIIQHRPSGGESVLLTPNTLVISFNIHTKEKINPKKFFIYINSTIIKALESLGYTDLSVRGISDICLGPKKILGCSIYRNANGILYQSVLNVSENPTLFSKYLKHPEREPDYRKGRKHGEFVTTLASQQSDLNSTMLSDKLSKIIKHLVNEFDITLLR